MIVLPSPPKQKFLATSLNMSNWGWTIFPEPGGGENWGSFGIWAISWRSWSNYITVELNLVKVTWKAKLFLFIASAVSHHLLPMVTSWFFFFFFFVFILFIGTYTSIFWNIYIASSNLASPFVTRIKITPNSKIKNKVSIQISLEKNSSNFSYIYIYIYFVNFENLTIKFHVPYVLSNFV